jgi:hypothetical protein
VGGRRKDCNLDMLASFPWTCCEEMAVSRPVPKSYDHISVLLSGKLG